MGRIWTWNRIRQKDSDPDPQHCEQACARAYKFTMMTILGALFSSSRRILGWYVKYVDSCIDLLLCHLLKLIIKKANGQHCLNSPVWLDGVPPAHPCSRRQRISSYSTWTCSQKVPAVPVTTWISWFLRFVLNPDLGKLKNIKQIK